MELFFLAVLLVLMAGALASGFPVAFALPGSAIISILLAAGSGQLFAGDPSAYFAHGGPIEWLTAGVTNFRGIYWEAERDTLIAIPLFVFMGIMLQRSKIAEDLLVTMAKLFGPVPGGLGISVVFVGALLAATTGILGATVVAMGLISLPAMQRNGYNTSLSTGTIAASGTLGQIIPPSIVLIILADQLSSAVDQAATARTNLYRENTGELSMPSEFAVTSTSAGDMFMGALLPGLVLVGLFMVYILVIALIRPRMAPAVPFEGRFDRQMLLRVLMILIPPLTLIFVVLGSIIAGVATVNQAGAIGAVGATVMAATRLRVGHPGAFLPAILASVSLIAIGVIVSVFEPNVKNIQTAGDRLGVWLAALATAGFIVSVVWSLIRVFKIENTLSGVMLETAKTTSLVFIILLGAAMLVAAFRAFGGEELVRNFLQALPGGFWTQFVIVMVVIFLLGFFLDFIEIAVVVVPIVAPILLMDPQANVTAVWLGVMIGLNIQSSFLTPPFGFALFYLRGVAPREVKTTQIYKGVIPFIGLQLIALGIVAATPQLVNYLPNRISLTADTSPPPVNPRLQHCLEIYVRDEIDDRGDTILASIRQAQGLPLDVLPRDVQRDLAESFEQAESVFDRLAAITAAEQAVADAAPEYRPVHDLVRALERDIRSVDRQIEEVEDQINDLRFSETPQPQQRAALEADIADLQAERESLVNRIPNTWDAQYETFALLTRAEINARTQYRRTADSAYETVAETIERLEVTPRFAELAGRFDAIVADLATGDPEAIDDRLSDLSGAISEAEGGSAITGALRDARRPLRRADTADQDEVRDAIAEAKAAFDAELAWRQSAMDQVLPDLRTYETAIEDTIGLRQQPSLPRDVALYLSGCLAKHRDISLNF